MSGIGEAGAVIGVVQVGFSLARTLNTYIGDYKDSRDSIISLASELDATIIQVKELNSLVGNSKTASEGSKKLAEKCIKDSDRLVKTLVNLLTKARLPEDPETIVNINPGDIIPSRLTKAYWPFVKPQVDVVKSELQVMKTDILIARSCIQSQSAATAADRTAGEESIVALARSRVIARKLLREAMAEEKRSIAAIQGSVSAPDTHLVQIPAPNGVDNTQGGGAVTSPPSKPPASNTTEPQRDDASGNAADDARITKLAQDIQASVQAELTRKDEERKANETAEEAVKKSAVEAYQKSVGDRLGRLLNNTEATARLLKEVFGADLDREKVKKFLVEQQSQQLKEEFGDMLSQFGVKPPVLHGGMDVDPHTGPTRPAVPLARRRWFFKRQFPRYFYGYDVDSSRAPSTISISRRGSSTSNDPEDFLHVAVSYNLGEGKHSFQSYDHTVLKHKPCGPACDLQTTMRLWQTLPESVKQSVSAWVEEKYDVKESGWNLHSAIPVAKSTPRTRKLLQRLVLGATARETASSILLILSSSERPHRLGSSTDSVRTVSSSASNSPAPASKGDFKKLQTELAAMATELKALRAAQVDSVVGADAHMPPIKFKDAVGRKFTFAWHICKTWKGMESLIKQSFLHVDVIGPHVQEGHYDLMGPDGTIILPQLWDTMVRPDWDVTMYMWPIPEAPKKKDKKAKKANPVIEPPIIHDPIGKPVIDRPFAGVHLHDFVGLDPSTSIAERKAEKRKSRDKDRSEASTPVSGPILEAYPPMPPMPSEQPQAVPISAETPPMSSKPPQSAPVAIEMQAKMRNAVLEERIKPIGRGRFSGRPSTHAGCNFNPGELFSERPNTHAGSNFDYGNMNRPMAYSGIDDSRNATKQQDDGHTKEYVLDEPAAFLEDSDAEDAMLDDEALKNKMLMKYAGGVATLDESEPHAGRSSQERLDRTLKHERRSRAYRSRSRENVATFQ